MGCHADGHSLVSICWVAVAVAVAMCSHPPWDIPKLHASVIVVTLHRRQCSPMQSPSPPCECTCMQVLSDILQVLSQHQRSSSLISSEPSPPPSPSTPTSSPLPSSSPSAPQQNQLLHAAAMHLRSRGHEAVLRTTLPPGHPAAAGPASAIAICSSCFENLLNSFLLVKVHGHHGESQGLSLCHPSPPESTSVHHAAHGGDITHVLACLGTFKLA